MDALELLLRDRDRLIDDLEAQLRARIEAVAGRLKQYFGNEPLSTFGNTAAVAAGFQEAGIDDIVAFLGHDQRLSFVVRLAEALGHDVDNMSASQVDRIRRTNEDLLDAVFTTAAMQFRTEMLRAALDPTATIEDAVNRAVDLVIPILTRQVELAMNQWDRQVQDVIASESGAEHFIYLGPKDSKNRPFCREMMSKGKVYTEKEIEALNNHPLLNKEVPPNIRTMCGGYGCRHTWAPVPASYRGRS